MSKPVDLVIRVKADTGEVAPGMQKLDHELDQATKSAQALDKELGDVSKHDVDLDVNTQAVKAARDRINDLRDDIAKMKTVDIDADTKGAEQEIAKLKRSIKALSDDAKDVDVGSGGGFAKVAKDADEGFGHASERVGEFKDEARQNFGEITSSFAGSMDSVTDLVQGTLGGLAGSLAGPVGLALGGASVAVGLVTSKLQGAADAANQVTDNAIALSDSFAGANDQASRVQVLQDRWKDFGNTINDTRSIYEVWQSRAVTNMEKFAASARLAGLDVDALFKGFTDPDPERRVKELNAVLDQQKATLKELNSIGDSQAGHRGEDVQARVDERDAITSTTKALKEEIATSQAAIELDEARAEVSGQSVEAWQAQQAAIAETQAAQETYNQTLKDSADPVNIYTDILQTKTEEMKTAAQEHADSTKEATGQAADSWEDYATDVTVSAQDLIDTWNRQTEQAKNFETNLGIIAAAGGQALADELRAKGPEVAGAVAEVIATADPATQQAAINAHANATGAAVGDGIAAGIGTKEDEVQAAIRKLFNVAPQPIPFYIAAPGGKAAAPQSAGLGGVGVQSAGAVGNVRVYIDGNQLRATVRTDIAAASARAALVGTGMTRP